ncbi:PRC-barrel domain-containing protein [Inquilinus sp. CAU 1745]|uniref:PRC-barrel domain-containing protein n=1 Tax=Inquilinus sp. CAU 1745 TaxID=3140369 RepID=UPI00325A875C
MDRKTLLAIAACMLFPTAAWAQDTGGSSVEGTQADEDTTPQMEAAPDPQTSTPTLDDEPAADVQAMAGDSLYASDLIGTSIVQDDGTEIGEISDVLLSRGSENVKEVIVDVGGFLGMGEKTVGIAMDQLEGPTEEGTFMTSMTREELEQLPEMETPE